MIKTVRNPFIFYMSRFIIPAVTLQRLKVRNLNIYTFIINTYYKNKECSNSSKLKEDKNSHLNLQAVIIYLNSSNL